MTSTQPDLNFLDLDPEYCCYDSARFAVLPIPYEGTVSYGKGTARAPQAIIKASSQVELFDEELGGEFYQPGIFTAGPVDCKNAEPQEVQQRIETVARKLLADGKFVLALGGEHSISAALVKAAAQRWDGLSVLHLDAHADLRDSYQGSKYSHACVMRRIGELSVPTVSVGLRSYSLQESKLLNGSAQLVVTARQVVQARHDSQAIDRWTQQVVKALSEQVYMSIDIDVFDPAQAPGTGTPEPGGLDWYDVIGLLRQVARNKEIVSADIVEVVPQVAGEVTEFLAARLAYKIVVYGQQTGPANL